MLNSRAVSWSEEIFPDSSVVATMGSKPRVEKPHLKPKSWLGYTLKHHFISHNTWFTFINPTTLIKVTHLERPSLDPQWSATITLYGVKDGTVILEGIGPTDRSARAMVLKKLREVQLGARVLLGPTPKKKDVNHGSRHIYQETPGLESPGR